MKKLSTLFAMSLTVLLLSVSEKTTAQYVNVLTSELRKANETAQKLKVCNAENVLLSDSVSKTKKHLKASQDSTSTFKKESIRFKKGRNNWRKVATVVTIIATIKTAISLF